MAGRNSPWESSYFCFRVRAFALVRALTHCQSCGIGGKLPPNPMLHVRRWAHASCDRRACGKRARNRFAYLLQTTTDGCSGKGAGLIWLSVNAESDAARAPGVERSEFEAMFGLRPLPCLPIVTIDVTAKWLLCWVNDREFQRQAHARIRGRKARQGILRVFPAG